jgi:hypothetical protein
MKTAHKQTQRNIKSEQFRFIRESSKLNMQNILLISGTNVFTINYYFLFSTDSFHVCINNDENSFIVPTDYSYSFLIIL